MIGKTRRKRTWFVAAVLAAGSLFATALPANAETGVSSSEIKLGITLPLTGAASPGYNKIGNAMNAYFKYVNDNGGVTVERSHSSRRTMSIHHSCRLLRQTN